MNMAEVAMYQALAIKHGLVFYARHGVRINRAYTPKNMMAMATKITGRKFKPRDYMGAVAALQEWTDKERGIEAHTPDL